MTMAWEPLLIHWPFLGQLADDKLLSRQLDYMCFETL